jgi:hypothetical protein
MQNSAWVALLRHLPPEQHNQFMLVTVGGTEIAVQSLLRIEQELVVVKGRLSGSQEAGRLFFIPYDHIDYFGSANPVKDTEFNETFGSLILPDAAAAPAQPEPGVLASAPAPPDSGSRPVIRSEVLDRYRSRPSSAAMLPNAKPNGT